MLLQRPPRCATQTRALVTGGRGSIGSHLCARLIEQCHSVLCVDNFFTGTRANVSQLLGHPDFEFMRHDITFPRYVEVDAIYNLACPTAPVHYQFDPVHTTKTSVMGAVNMLGLAQLVLELTRSSAKLEFWPLPQDGPKQRRPDSTVAREIPGWRLLCRYGQASLQRSIIFARS